LKFILDGDDFKSMRFFPINAELSASGFKPHKVIDKFSQFCTPKFETDGDLTIIDVKIAFGEVATFFSIEFINAKRYDGRTPNDFYS